VRGFLDPTELQKEAFPAQIPLLYRNTTCPEIFNDTSSSSKIAKNRN